MKVLMINGSPHTDGNTALALKEMGKVFAENNIDYEIVNIGTNAIRGCIACGTCHTNGQCVFDDMVNEVNAKFKEADGLVVGSPVYYASANASVIALLDRMFYSSNFDKTMKVGCSVVVASRGGLSSTFDELNKYFSISQMPIVSSTYWNSVHGAKPNEAALDLEGMQVMRNLALNMTFLMKAIALGKKEYGLPAKEKKIATNFIR